MLARRPLVISLCVVDYIFILLGASGEELATHKIAAVSDEEALEIAHILRHPFAIRVYEGDRLVGLVIARERNIHV